MPGVIMENGSRNGSHTNHDRDQRTNGINGAGYGSEKGKGQAEPLQNVTPVSPTRPNGVINGKPTDGTHTGKAFAIPQDVKSQMDQLPPEIPHIVTGFLPLSSLLSRLAQKTHNDLSRTITELAQMPLPAAVVNGNGSHAAAGDDNSQENLAKKQKLLNFAQDAHTEWTKALIITNWSRRSEEVSKLIDLKCHLDQQKTHYDFAIHQMSELKMGLSQARLPNPDLKTALAVLTTGKASWMPELGYIQPPPLTGKELLKSLENLNTLLSIRLNLHEYDNIPFHFMDYTIKSGRVTFNVAGEFAIDLTIADEDPEAQFWFIDFRFLFSPALLELPPHIRDHIETRVNDSLMKDGLAGCYNFLHGMVLTHKISEFKRQAVGLARERWVECLQVETLNRAISIQYWLDRYGRKGPKSWIILGVHSGKRKVGRPHPQDTSRLSLRWFRDSKEVKDVDISFDTVNISAESLLKTVIAKHVNLILTSTYDKLRAKPMFATNEAFVSLSTSITDPEKSELRIQMTKHRHLTVNIEPITGRFVLGPSSRLAAEYSQKINGQCIDPATNAHNYLEEYRQRAVMDDIVQRGLSLGWIRTRNPGIKQDDLKAVLQKDAQQVLWLQRAGWVKNWYFAVTFSSSGERWWSIETTDPAPDASIIPPLRNQKTPALSVKIKSCIPIPIKNISPNTTYGFLANVHVFAAALVSQYANIKDAHARRTRYKLYQSNSAPAAIKLPALYLQLSDLITAIAREKKTSMGKMSLRDMVQLNFLGLETHTAGNVDPQAGDKTSQEPTQTPGSQASRPTLPREDVFVLAEARMAFQRPPAALEFLKENIDRDIAFHNTSGAFAIRLRSRVGESTVPNLVERVVRIQRLVDFIQVLHNQEDIRCEIISLGRITFSYGKVSVNNKGNVMQEDGPRHREHTAVVDFSAADNVMTLILERGNPHLAIIDHLTRVLNGEQGLGGVARLLPLTLPVLEGLDAIEMAWVSVTQGRAFVNVRALDWYIIRYNINLAASNPPSPKVKKVMFEVKLRHRRGVPWWNIRRLDRYDKDNKGIDEGIDEALKPVWNTAGDGWQGMRVNGVGQAGGVEELLGKVDEAMRRFVTTNESIQAPSAAPAQAQAKALGHPNGQQQPTPNQSQSQGRNNATKQEFIEID